MIFVAFVIPLGIYCLALSILHRRRHPVFVPGPWDFAGVLFAVSGLLLLGGPAILTAIYEQWRFSWLLGQTHLLQGIGDNWGFWISLWLLYFVSVVGASALVLWRRRGLTSIYNVEPAVFAQTLPQVLEQLQLESIQTGPGCLLLRFREPPFEADRGVPDAILMRPRSRAIGTSAFEGHARGSPPGTTTRAMRAPRSASPWAILSVDAFPAMRHVSLHWLGQAESLRREVETQLARALARVPTGRNPVAAWLLSVSVALFFSGFLVLGVLSTMRILLLLR